MYRRARAYPSPFIPQDFLSPLLIFFAMISSLLVGYLIYTYTAYTKMRTQTLDAQSGHLERTFAEIADYTEHQLHQLAHQITLIEKAFPSKEAQLEQIKDLFLSLRTQSRHALLPWNMFTLATPPGQIIISSLTGFLPEPISIVDLEYYRFTSTNFAQMTLSKKGLGQVSKSPVIVAAYGIQGKNGDFFGTIATGIQLRSLQQKLAQNITHRGIHFVLLDEEGEETITSVLQSKEESLLPIKQFQQWNKDKKTVTFGDSHPTGLFKPSLFASPIYYSRLPKFGQTLLVFYNQAEEAQQRINFIFKTLLTVVCFFLPLLIASLFLWQRLFRPLLLLAEMAEKQSHYAIPHQFQYKIFNTLATQLEEGWQNKIKLIQASEYSQQAEVQRFQAEKTLRMSLLDYEEKIKKLGRLVHSLHDLSKSSLYNLEYLVYNTHETGSETMPPFSNSQRWAHLERNFLFFRTVRQHLEQFHATAPAITLTESTLSVQDMVEYALSLHQIHARFYSVQWHTSFSTPLPLLRGDAVLLRELLYHAFCLFVAEAVPFSELRLSAFLSETGTLRIELQHPLLSPSFPIEKEGISFCLPKDSHPLLYLTEGLMQYYALLHGIELSKHRDPKMGYFTITFPKSRLLEIT